MQWSGYNWILQERWGQIHPDKTYCWYDPSCIETDENGFLHLKTKFNPKFFPELNLTSTVGIGLISCTEKFYHGTYEIEAQLPTGKNLWPAFWMWSWDSWPPEIDVFEAYTGKTEGYFDWNPIKLWDIQTNIHYSTEKTNRSIGAKKHWLGFKNPAKNFIKYKLDWRENYVKFYYNDILVRTVTNPSVLKALNATTMNVIINNSIDNNADKLNPPKSDFIVKYFKYNS